MKKHFAKCSIWSALLYGCEIGTIAEQNKNKLEAMKMWIWKRIMKVSWTKMKINLDVEKQVGKKRFC